MTELHSLDKWNVDMLLITCQLCNRSIERERMLPLSAGVATAADAGAAVYSCGSKYITK